MLQRRGAKLAAGTKRSIPPSKSALQERLPNRSWLLLLLELSQYTDLVRRKQLPLRQYGVFFYDFPSRRKPALTAFGRSSTLSGSSLFQSISNNQRLFLDLAAQ